MQTAEYRLQQCGLLQQSVVSLPAEDVKEKLAEIFANIDRTESAYPVLLKHGWNGSAFEWVVDLDLFKADLTLVLQVRLAELTFVQFIEEKEKTTLPKPVPDIMTLTPLLSLRMLAFKVEAAESEHDIKAIEATLKTAHTKTKEVIGSVNGASKQLADCVQRAEARKKKQEVQRAKAEEQEKAKAAKQLQKQQEKSGGKTSKVPHSLSIPYLILLFAMCPFAFFRDACMCVCVRIHCALYVCIHVG